jgi:hypothetical protein
MSTRHVGGGGGAWGGVVCCYLPEACQFLQPPGGASELVRVHAGARACRRRLRTIYLSADSAPRSTIRSQGRADRLKRYCYDIVLVGRESLSAA